MGDSDLKMSKTMRTSIAFLGLVCAFLTHALITGGNQGAPSKLFKACLLFTAPCAIDFMYAAMVGRYPLLLRMWAGDE